MTTPTVAAALPITWQLPTYRGHFQQLSLEDRAIWSRFLDQHSTRYTAFAYDVPVGGVDCDDLDVPDNLRDGWRYCTAKRIDVLAADMVGLTIFEVRYQAGVSAIGALLVYRILLAEHNPRAPSARLHLVTDQIAPDTLRAARALGLTVTILPG